MTAKEYLKQAYLLDKQIQVEVKELEQLREMRGSCLLYTSPSPRDGLLSRMPSSA